MRLARSRFVNYLKEDGLGSETIYSILESRAGELCVLSAEGYINRYDKGRFTAIRPRMPAFVSELNHRWLMQDRTGEWWLATKQGLCRYPNVSRIEQLATALPKAFYTVKDGLADNDVRCIYEDSRGDIWINSFMPGREVLTRWERTTETFHRYSDTDGLQPFRSAWMFGEDAAGNVWISFREGPLARYRAGRFTIFTADDGLPAGTIYNFHADRAGRFWLASIGGGLRYIEDPSSDRPRFVMYPTDQAITTDRAVCIAEDNEGNLYAGTGSGIDRIDRATGSIKRYTAADGLTSEPLVAYRDRAGTFWFGSLTGLLRFKPGPESDRSPPPTLIGGVRISGLSEQVSELGESEMSGIEVEPDRNHIAIDFFGLSLSRGEALRYQFKIEGVDSDWSAPADQRSVNLSLAPGTYRFLVRAVSPDGATSMSPASVGSKVLPPLWQRWWFRTLALLLIGSLALAFVRSRAKRIKSLRESENRFRALAETASDAIFTIDEQNFIVFANPAAEIIFGYRVEEMLGKAISGLIPGYLRPLRLAGYGETAEASLNASWDGREVRGIHKCGHEIPLELSFGQFVRDGNHYHTIIARDVTERKRAEEALRRSREERLVELEQVRRRIATDLHDDIGSSLSQISLLSEVVRQQVRDDSQVSEPLSMISRASYELVSSMSDIVWAINPNKDSLSDLAHRMRRFASDTLGARNIAFQFRAPVERDLRLGANIRREVFLIFKESLNNLARHSGCAEADIEFQITDDRLMLRVADNGKGFDSAESNDGHGLLSMRERAKGIGGRLDLVSARGKGTTVMLVVPLGQ